MAAIHSPSPVAFDRRRLDTEEAPEGYTAWLKFDVSDGPNICRKCDYRETCLTIPGKCRADQRKDNCSVFYIAKKG